MLEKQGIEPKKTGNIYYGDTNFILPVLLEDGIYYFKFFMNPIREHIEADVMVVEYLRENGVEVPEFYCKEGNKIFTAGNEVPFNTIFYGSSHVDAEEEPDMPTEVIEDIIRHIAQMHLMLKEFDKSKIDVEKITDYQRLIQLYINKKDLCDERGMSETLERIISIGTDRVETYPIHSDLHSANIMMENNRFKAFIDFSDVRESYFEDDLGKFFQNLLGAKNVSLDEIKRLMDIYEQESGIKPSRKNVYSSTIFRILDRYFWKLSRGVQDTGYDIKIQGIFEELAKELEKTVEIDEKKGEDIEAEGGPSYDD